MIARWHADAILQIEGARLCGVADTNSSAGEIFANKYGIRFFRSVDELLYDTGIDVVCICTPSGFHAEQAIKAANAGKHIVLEKPIALTLEDSDRIIEACRKNCVKATVISQFRFSESLKLLKDAVDNKMLGKIVMGSIYMKYFRDQEYYGGSSWKGTKAMDGGGALMNQGIHGVDLLLHVMGTVKSVFSRAKTLVHSIEVEDTACAVIEYMNGAIGVIQATTSVYPGYPRRLEVNGDKGSIVLEEDAIAVWDVKGEKVPENINLGRAVDVGSSNPSAIGLSGHIRQISDLVDAIHNDRKPFIDISEGRKAIELILAIYESEKTGKMINL